MKVKQVPGLAKSLPEHIDDARKNYAPWDNLDFGDFHVEVYFDKYPVTKGHRLFVPVYPTTELITDCFADAISYGMRMVEDKECEGFNVGFNFGKVAGQTVPWPHVHLILRRKDDCEDPTGGVRNVIPGKGCYN